MVRPASSTKTSMIFRVSSLLTKFLCVCLSHCTTSSSCSICKRAGVSVGTKLPVLDWSLWVDSGGFPSMVEVPGLSTSACASDFLLRCGLADEVFVWINAPGVIKTHSSSRSLQLLQTGCISSHYHVYQRKHVDTCITRQTLHCLQVNDFHTFTFLRLQFWHPLRDFL